MYIVAGHKGHPEAVRAQGRLGRRRRLKGERGRGTWEKDKPPVFGMIERGGAVVIRRLANVQQATPSLPQDRDRPADPLDDCAWHHRLYR